METARSGAGRAWGVFVLGLGLTLWAAQGTHTDVHRRAQERFDRLARDAAEVIQVGMADYAQILLDSRAFYTHDTGVSRLAWHQFVARLALDQNRPGIQGVGVSLLVPAAGLAEHQRRIRAEGLTGFTVHPVGKRPLYTSIVYLEPFNERNQRALGYDMYTSPVRRAALDQACDTGRAVLTPKVRLIQETQVDVQAGTLLYLPIYREGASLSTVAERRAALTGFVYAPFRMNDLFGGFFPTPAGAYHMEVFDGSEPLAERRMVPSGVAATRPVPGAPAFVTTRVIAMPGRTWTLRLSSWPAFEESVDLRKPVEVALAGMVISLLAFGGMMSLATTRRDALENAERLVNETQATKARLANILATAQEGFLLLDREHVILEVNDAICKLLGRSSPELVGAQVIDLVADESREVMLANLALRSEGQATSYEVTFLTPAGRRISCLISGAPLREPDGTMVGAFALITDVTPIKLAEFNLRGALDAEQQLNQVKTNFIATVSHEFRTPLASIHASAQILERLGAALSEAERLENLHDIQAGVRHMVLLLDDVLFISRADADRIVTNPTRVDLSEMLGTLVKEVARAGTDGRAIQLEVHCEPTQTVDVALTRTMVSNLLSNAIKYSDPTTPIRVAVERSEHALRLEVEDQGIGIPPDALARIGSAFFRADNVSLRPGTGLGLSIVKRAAGILGGELKIDSRLGKGTRAVLVLPVIEEV